MLNKHISNNCMFHTLVDMKCKEVSVRMTELQPYFLSYWGWLRLQLNIWFLDMCHWRFPHYFQKYPLKNTVQLTTVSRDHVSQQCHIEMRGEHFSWHEWRRVFCEYIKGMLCSTWCYTYSTSWGGGWGGIIPAMGVSAIPWDLFSDRLNDKTDTWQTYRTQLKMSRLGNRGANYWRM